MQAYFRAQETGLGRFLASEGEDDFWAFVEDDPDFIPRSSPWLPCPSCGDDACTHDAAGVVVHCCLCGYHADLSLDFLKSLDQDARNRVMFEHLLWSMPDRDCPDIHLYPI